MSTKLETKVTELETQLAALRGDVEFLLKTSPAAFDRRMTQKRQSDVERAKSIDSLAALDRLTPGEQTTLLKHLRVPQLIAMCRGAKHAARDRLLERLDLDRRARVVYALAPAPALVRVSNPEGYNTRTTPIDKTTAQTLASVGLPIERRSQRGEESFALSGWRGHAREVVLDEAAWEARCSYDAQLADLTAAGKFTATRLPDDEARAYVLQRYLQLVQERPSNNAPQLPSL